MIEHTCTCKVVKGLIMITTTRDNINLPAKLQLYLYSRSLYSNFLQFREV